MAAARIGRIRMKTSGAELRILHQDRKDPGINGSPENWCGKIIGSARKVAEYSEPGSELCGYVMLGFYTDGAHSLGFRYDKDRCVIPPNLIPSYVAELLRGDMITKRMIEDD